MKVLRKDHYRAHHLAVWNNLIPDLISSTRVTPFYPPPNTPSTTRFEVPPVSLFPYDSNLIKIRLTGVTRSGGDRNTSAQCVAENLLTRVYGCHHYIYHQRRRIDG